jgi:hypothetical protein
MLAILELALFFSFLSESIHSDTRTRGMAVLRNKTSVMLPDGS